MPRLLTRISTSGNCFTSAAQPAALPRSNAAACTLADGAACWTFATASPTAALSRPLTITSAPICASPLAVASPMPRVEPVTSAVLSVRSRSMRYPLLIFLWPLLFGRRYDEDIPGRRGAGHPQKVPPRGHHYAPGIGGMGLHPRLAFFQLPVADLADADEARSLRFVERGQARRPGLVRRQRRRMIGAVEGDGLAGIGIGRDHRPARIKPRVPGFRQSAGEFGTRPIGRACGALFAYFIGDDP